MKGKVKWFKNEKGFGFIAADDKTVGDCFVHHSEIQMDGFKTLTEGQIVEFSTEPGMNGKGPKAKSVRVVG